MEVSDDRHTGSKVDAGQAGSATQAEVISNVQHTRKLAASAYERCQELEGIATKEGKDLARVDGRSLTALFYTMLGTKAERVDKERKEYLEAKLKHDEAVASFNELRGDMRRLDNELGAMKNAEVVYEQLLKEKEQRLANGDDENGRQLLEIAEQLADLHANRRELDEAIQAGGNALYTLQRVSDELAAASGWGTWDMLGGGMISTMAKHSKIDAAKDQAHYAQMQLRRFQEELADTNERLQMALEIGGFTKFADLFLDGLIFDWMVQSRLSEATSACLATTNQVVTAINRCKRRLQITEHEISELTEHRRKLIEEA